MGKLTDERLRILHHQHSRHFRQTITRSETYRALAELIELRAEIERLQMVCAEAYQMAGALDAPVEALDNLCAAAGGQPLPHSTFLPVHPKEALNER